jgi:7-cyano-7-deazaguanine synthase in queuosine biosynthesis
VQSFSPEEVILFSGGLDSLAGTVEALSQAGRRVALVSHQASSMIASKQNGLIALLRERTGSDSCFFVPVTVNKGNEEALEFTQRTRSFMFASLAFVVARMFNRDNLSFYENGVVSINLPVAEHVLGARASRTTHPKFLADCSRLFSLLLDAPFTLCNPFIWKTKTEVVRILAEYRATNMIANSFSCTRVREATKRKQHCGVCSQCVDRRVAILAAGMSEHDPSENYAVDLFTGSHESGSALTMVEGYVLRAQKLATMSQQAFAASYGQIFRAVEHLPGSPDENVSRLWDLHRRHGKEVVSVVDHELQTTGTLDQALSIPDKSLLAIVHSPFATQPAYTDPSEAEPTAARQAGADSHEYKWEAIGLAIDPEAKRVVFSGDLEVGGSAYGLLQVLAMTFEADVEAGTFIEHHTFVKANALARRLRIAEPSLRQRISRVRKLIAARFIEKLNREIAADDIIQNEGLKGYRLNPHLVLLKPSQLRRGAGPLSHVGSHNVTAPGVTR